MNKLEEIERAKKLIKMNKIHPLDLESAFLLISNEQKLTQTEKAQRILDYNEEV